MNKFQSYKKVVDCIKSCTKSSQWISSLRMIKLHYKMYKDDYLNDSMRIEHNKWFVNRKDLNKDSNDLD